MAKPHLTFFCELESHVLEVLFAVPDIDLLAEMDASISLGILDLTPQRADVVRRLNQAGVPVVAWLLLPKEDGYWLNIDNAPAAVQRYREFKAWSEENGLVWDGIGLDIQPDIYFIEEFQKLWVNKRRIFRKIILQAFNRRRLMHACKLYKGLIQQIQQDGFRVDSYQYPFIVDERITKSKLVQRATGIVDLDVDREVLRLYSSMARPYGAGIVWSYSDGAQSVAVGSTGGGVDMGVLETRPLTWGELERDLRLAWVHTSDIHIFSLEGCIRQGYLAKLKDFEWDQPIIDPVEMTARVDSFRAAFQSVLWLTGHPLLIGTLLAGLVAVVWKVRSLNHEE